MPNAIHWEVMMGTERRNTVYCTKDGTPYLAWGVEIRHKFTMSLNLHDWQKELVEIMKTDPDDRTIFWIWESIGGAGKTMFGKWIAGEFPHVLVLGGKASDVKHGVVSYKEKQGQVPNILIWDVPRGGLKYVSYVAIEEVKNMFFFSGKYEGGMIRDWCPHLFVFANEPPQKEMLSEDRWKIAEIVHGKLRWND